MKPKVTKEKYSVDVCRGATVALFPDGTVRPFRNTEECLFDIKQDQGKRKVKADEMRVAIIQWNYSNCSITEEVDS
jgi:hypothetical protein